MTVTKSRKKTKKVKDETVYELEVLDWDLKYSLSKEGAWPRAKGDRCENVVLALSVAFIRPAEHRGRQLAFWFIANDNAERGLIRPDREGHEGTHLGTLTIRRQEPNFVDGLPSAALWGLVSALAAGKLTRVHLVGDKLSVGSNEIRLLSFHS